MSALPPVQWKPLPIFVGPAALEADLPAIKAAKAALGVAYTVKPVEAESGVSARVLAWGGTPGFLCDYALVAPGGSAAELEDALGWVLGEWDECEVSCTVEQQLQAWLHPDVREVSAAELEAEARLAAYEAGA
jgi:hypothetical protein